MQSVFHFPPDTVPYLPEDYCKPLNLAEMFPGQPDAPLEVDIGCGDGAFLVEMATREPEHNFVGIERLLGRIRKTSRRTARQGLTNVRLLRLESHYTVKHLLTPESVAVVHIMFPDPWPKRRHNIRRLFQTEFLDSVRAVLQPDGEVRLSTDDLPYYQHMRKVFSAHTGFSEEPWEPGADYPQTDFERRFRERELPIHRALIRKVDSGAE